jgi:uncharacterized protein YaaR (DUF327 family)
MRIGDVRRKGDAKGSERSGAVKPKGLRALFSGRLATEESKLVDYQLELEELKSAIDRAGDTLDQQPTVANFREFRDLLGAITKKVLEMAYRLEKVGGTPFDPHYHEIVAIIDRESDHLYQLMLRQQRDHVAITTKIMEIKGLVVDLLS